MKISNEELKRLIDGRLELPEAWTVDDHGTALSQEVQPARWRHRRTAVWFGVLLLYISLSFGVGLVAAELVMGARLALLRSGVSTGDLVVRWLQAGAR